MHSSRPQLRLHKGGLAPTAPPTAEQLELGAQNHRNHAARTRDLRAEVRRQTYKGRRGLQTFTTRHIDVITELALHADVNGEVHPIHATLGTVAQALGRDHENVCRDVRDLESVGVIRRRRIPRSRVYVYLIPAMVAPPDVPR